MILAIDPSINNIGWAFGAGELPAESGVIRTKGSCDPEKLEDLAIELRDVLDRAKIEAAGVLSVAVEVPEGFTYGRSTRNGKALNARSLMTLSRAIGAILLTLRKHDCAILEVPASWKGMAGKKMVQAVTGKTNHNEADAVLLYRWFWGRQGAGR